ncbi:MAG: hypothetical protein LBP76_09535 [Treponema sp.]|nr:hypothetical protein [Treponema sp.]
MTKEDRENVIKEAMEKWEKGISSTFLIADENGKKVAMLSISMPRPIGGASWRPRY